MRTLQDSEDDFEGEESEDDDTIDSDSGSDYDSDGRRRRRRRKKKVPEKVVIPGERRSDRKRTSVKVQLRSEML